jgi:hypothetical protein
MAEMDQPNAPDRLPSEYTIERMQALREKRKGRRGVKWTPELQENFLDLYRELGSARKCAEILGISTVLISKKRNGDPDFDEECIQCEEDFADMVDENITQRALMGVEEPVVYQGKIMKDENGHPLKVSRQSDRLAELVVKAQRPDKYRERKEITGAGGGEFTIAIKSSSDMASERKPDAKIKRISEDEANRQEVETDEGEEVDKEEV